MTMPRYGFGAVVTGGKLYAIGSDRTARSMEYFDPNGGPQGQWTLMDESREFAEDAKLAAI